MPRCPHCRKTLFTESDDFGNYYSCTQCAREFDLGMRPRRMTPKELYSRFGIKPIEGKRDNRRKK